jgi:exo-1,4-beta-D-glucosaminidase
VFQIPQVEGLSKTYFVRLTLADDGGKTVDSNFYWLSTQPDVSNWGAGNGRYTPIQTYADLTGLEQLPRVKVKAASRSEQQGKDQVEHVTVENTGSGLAFMVHLTARNATNGADVKPVYWEDNYFELMPGERREVTVTFPRILLAGAKCQIQVDGWNVE